MSSAPLIPLQPLDGPDNMAPDEVLRLVDGINWMVLSLLIASTLGSLIVIITFIAFRAMRHHPINLVFLMSICDILYSIALLVSEIFEKVGYEGPATLVMWWIYRYFITASVSWFTMICVDLIITTMMPFFGSFKLFPFYHIYAWTIPACSTGLSYYYGAYSTVSDPTKPVRFEWEFEVPTLLAFAMAFMTVVLAFMRFRILTTAYKHTKHVITRLLVITTAFLIIWLGPTVAAIYSAVVAHNDRNRSTEVALKIWMMSSLSLVGLLNATVWSSFPTVKKRLKRSLCCSKKKDDAQARQRLLSSTKDEELREAPHFRTNRRIEYDNVMHSEFVQLSQILRKNLLTCVLLGMQHSLFKLHSDDQPPARRESNRKKVNVKHHSSEDSKQDKAEEQLTDNADLVIDIVEENILSRVQHNDETWKAVDNTQKCSSQTYTRPIVTKLGPLTLKYDDFRTLQKYRLTPRVHKTSDEDIFVSAFDFIELAPKAFFNIRSMLNISDIEYYDMLNPVVFLNEDIRLRRDYGGRSGSILCYSPDKKFIMKTIEKHEFETLTSILPYYYAHLTRYPKSLLMRIIGAFSVTIMRTRLYVIIMTNVFEFAGMQKPLHQVFDLKGSWVDRGGGPVPKTSGVMKDADLHFKFDIGRMKHSDLMGQLKLDTRLLQGMNIMDYSLLVGVHNLRSSAPEGEIPLPDPDRLDLIVTTDKSQLLCLGVIDILQAYNASKKLERFVKVYCQCKEKDGISAAPPHEYAARFCSSIENVFE